MAKLYYYDTSSRSLVTELPEKVESVTQPTLATIQSWLQHPMGVLSPTSILTVDSAGKLDVLKVGVIQFAVLDGGEF